MSIPIGAQLYSVREELSKDYVGTLEKLAEIGFKGIEFYGDWKLEAHDLKACLDRLGMVSIGYHVYFEELRDNLEKVLEYNLAIGSRYLVCPWYTYRDRKDYLEASGYFNEIGAKCRKSAIQLCYHHHDAEFQKYEGEYGLDILFDNVNDLLLQAELDTYHIKYSGLDPVDYVKKYAGLCPLLHLRDIHGDTSRKAADMGKGVLNMEAVITAAKNCGVKWLIAEEEADGALPLVRAKNSYDYLRSKSEED